MKKVKFISVIALAAICAVFAAFATVGCGSSTLGVDTSGAVTVFAVGDTFSSDGIVVYEKQSDGKNVRVPRDGYTVSEPDMSTAGEKTVTITAGEQTVTYTISVVVPEVTATFAGDITGGLGGGATITYHVEFRCYNTFEWELWYYDGMPGTSGERHRVTIESNGNGSVSRHSSFVPASSIGRQKPYRSMPRLSPNASRSASPSAIAVSSIV